LNEFRRYAAYGGVYIFAAILWLWVIGRIRLTPWGMSGASAAITGMAIIMFVPQSHWII